MREFNRAVLALAGAHDPREDAPGTFAELMACGGRLALPVWAGASEKTIYGDASVNWAFRAWHDRTHIRYGLDFSRAGELAAARWQITEFRSLYPNAPTYLDGIIYAEIAAPLDYFAANGSFPLDGAACVRQWLGNIPKEVEPCRL